MQGMRLAEEQCKRALASTDQRAHARANAALSAIYLHEDKFDESLKYAQRAIELNPSDSMALYRRGTALLYVGRFEEAITAMETAKRFDPHAVVLRLNLGIAYFVKDRYRDALDQTDVGLTRAPHHVALTALRAAALAELGNADEARRAADEVRRLSPMFEAENFGARFANAEYSAKLQEGLRKAGL
jgi:tetratricopeptide (TPR) repeat protein